jgi:WD40 repeat protein
VGLVEGGVFRTVGRHEGEATSVDLDPQGAILASAGFDNAVRLWDVRNGRSLGRPLRGHIAFVSDVAVAPGGRGLASAGADGVIAVWDLQRPFLPARELRVGRPETEAPLAWTPDGRTLLAGGADGSITRWDASTGDSAPLTGARPAVQVVGLAVHPQGASLAAGTSTGPEFPKTDAVELWDLNGGRPQGKKLPMPEGLDAFSARTVAFSPDGRVLVGGGQGTVLIWRLDGSREPLRLAGDVAAFSPDGKRLAVTTGQPDDGTVRLYDVGSGKQRGKLSTGRNAFVWDVAFSPDGAAVAAGDNDGTVVLWDAHTKKRVGEPLTGFDSRVDHVAFSPDGRTLAAASSAQKIRLWDARTRQPLGLPLEGHFLAFSPGSDSLAASTSRGTAQVWSLDLGTLRKQACALAGRNLNGAEWEQFIGTLRDYEATCPDLPRGRPATPAVSAD